MTTLEYQQQLHVPELEQPREVSEDVRRALAHPTLQEAATEEWYRPCAD